MSEPKIFIDEGKIRAFCKSKHIASLALFGSVLTAHFSPSSDVDLLVEFDKEHIPTLFDLVGMEAKLSEIIGRLVDLKTLGDISPYFRDTVRERAKVIYGK